MRRIRLSKEAEEALHEIAYDYMRDQGLARDEIARELVVDFGRVLCQRIGEGLRARGIPLRVEHGR